MKENVPNLAQEIDFQEVQEAQRVPNKTDPKTTAPRHIITKMPKVKDKEGILKATREKQFVTKGVPIRLSADFSKRNLTGKKGLERSLPSNERQGLNPRLLYPAKLSFSMEGQTKCFLDKVKLKEFIIIKPITQNAKGNYIRKRRSKQ